jgi:hypothetical protein
MSVVKLLAFSSGSKDLYNHNTLPAVLFHSALVLSFLEIALAIFLNSFNFSNPTHAFNSSRVILHVFFRKFLIISKCS